MTTTRPVQRALLSVSDKTDLVPFARALQERGIEIVSTGGTHRALTEAGLAPKEVQALTGFPEMMDGRVKTLHPAVHGGILFRRDDETHTTDLDSHQMVPIDLVCVNLYPFERTIRNEGATTEEAIEQIDIGGPSMLRSAAKNHEFVTVVTTPDQYDRVINELDQNDGATSFELRREFAAVAFARTAEYDATIAAWMSRTSSQRFPSVLRLNYTGQRELRYGENPHQLGAVYRDPTFKGPSVVTAELLGGKPLSYNNLLDAAAALELIQDLHDLGESTVAAIVKHTNPCGAGRGDNMVNAFKAAHAGDPLAAFGGILAVDRDVDGEAAAAIVEESRFLEVLIAPSFTQEGSETLAARWPNCRLLAVGPINDQGQDTLNLRSVPGGLLAEERDTHPFSATDLRHLAGPEPSAELRQAVGLASTVVKHLKSNAVCIATPDRLIGAGAGQMDRVAACRIAVEKASKSLAAETGPIIAASDAFFPFPDGPEILIDAGVSCIVHPGGSKRDSETFELCEKRGVTCMLTGVRHFRH
ncbi:MAG: bifunctional phosphoribosylaminoimidazolecarboxamide formyltransferase/inosine monophosphate cyclohydrolase [Crocinitomicaceae bacterium]|nr:bifunctional phosphoribosylaminoimidazolecarboxamide formyltransferase/inosine monophosphate cyclohydrolase [Crocinitomicaceae bacterium]